MTKRSIGPGDVISPDQFGRERQARRADLLPKKRLRRVDVGPYCTFYFECFETMLFQIQEMLFIERGGDAQLADELAAYNPLVPQGDELVATIMFEIDDPRRRAAVLARLGGVEECFFVQVGDEKVRGLPEGDVERTRDDGKASSVQFVHFRFTPAQIGRFRDPQTQILAGVDHETYAHMAILSPAARAELAADFA
ncbi:MAG: hypothetical protein FD124_1818 [Alphaproteobacteria bacterium]|nr:MAG: hypothetical protein FD160_2389 [Caulobacteraceae bacterium]TPW06250.1 MAG: hypothetical protein FD124_1818 [Alphaproteobacteria bacterium]